MKKILSLLSLAVLTVGLLGSCSKINERLDNLDKRVDGIENEKIASINSQISGITSSIADLGQIRSDISSLKQSASDHSVDIFNLEEADRALKDRIVNLEDYVDEILPNYAEKEWVEATFSTLEQYEATCDTIAKIDARIGALDAKLSNDIKATADSLTKWVNKQFEAYYTAAEMDAKLAQMKSAVDSAKASGKISDAKADSIAAELAKTKTAVDTAKANIRKEYRAAIDTAIKTSEGKLTKALQEKISDVNGKIESLTTRVGKLETSVADLKGRVDKLEEMIQSVTIVPAYSDGSVKVEDDTLFIDLSVTPKDIVKTLDTVNFTILLNRVQTKAVALDTVPTDSIKFFKTYKENGTVSIKAHIKKFLAKLGEESLTVAVNIKNGISDFTTEFVPVYVAPAPGPEYVEMTMTVGGVEKTYKWAKCNIGATEETDYGRYYAWGDIIGQTAATSGAYAFATAFSWANCPFNNGEFNYDETYFSSVKETVCPGGVLKSDYDVAHKVLGGDWRMPTKEEFQALYDACLNDSYDTETNPSGASASVGKGVYWCTSYDGVAGCLFCDGTNKLFFPAAGNGNGTSLSGAGAIYGFYGFYCSSSLYSSPDPSPDNPPAQYAYSLIFDDIEVNPQNYGGRYCGFPVRPVSTEGVAPAPTPTTTGTAKRTGDIDVKWIQLWENGPKFAEYNVGVTDGKAESYGGYYTWGGTYENGQGITWSDDHNTGSFELSHTGEDITDTATNLWGSNWRMPTDAELQALLSNCDVEWIDGTNKKYKDTNITGLLCTGKGAYASNSVFLPAAGGCNEGTVTGQGAGGLFWSSSPGDSDGAYGLFFFGSPSVISTLRNTGGSVRAVLK